MKQFLFSRTGLVTILFIFVAGYFLWTEHKAHVIQYLPWLLLAACPLMHLFMHRGHGSGHEHASGPAHQDNSHKYQHSVDHSPVPITAKPNSNSDSAS